MENNLSDFKKYLKKSEIKITNNRDVVCYSRVSSKNQAEMNQSLSFQDIEINNFCKKNNYKIIKTYGHTYESAKGDFTRKEFVSLIDFVTNQKTKPFGIVVLQINRFSRSGAHSIGLLHQLVEVHKVHLIESSSGLDTTTETGYNQIIQKLLDSRKENLVRQETIIPRMKDFLHKGKWFGRSPFGYDHYGPRVKDENFLRKEQSIVVNQDGEKLREAFQMKLSGNYSDVKIVEFLKSKGVKISSQKISPIWKNPFYCGISSNSLLGDNVVEGNWEKIISRNDFLKLQKVLEKNTSGFKHKKQDDYKPLNHFLKCSGCGNKMVGYLNKKKNLPYYKCNYCKSVSLNGITSRRNTGANDLFLNLLKSYEINSDFFKLVELQMNKIYYHYNEVEIKNEKDLTDKIKKLEIKLDELDIRLGMNEIPLVVYEKTKIKLEGDIYDIRREKENLNPQLSNQEKIINKSLKNLENLNVLWSSIGLDDKQKLQNTLFPSGVFFDSKNHHYLTKEINSFILVSKCILNDYEKNIEQKKGTNQNFSDLSHSVA